MSEKTMPYLATLGFRVEQAPAGSGLACDEVTHYAPVAGPPPARRRIGPDPLDREEWFRARPR
jgi:ribosomal protection tetracycline resistance protein